MSEALERITKARINLQYSSPFFAYLSLHLKPQEFSKELEEHLKSKGQVPTLAVDQNSHLHYSSDYIATLDDADLTSSLVHEILHLSFGHIWRLSRQFKECPSGTNISADAVINRILDLNGFDMKSFKKTKLGEGILPDSNDVLSLGQPPKQIKIKDISKKTAEEIYDELMKQAKDKDMIKYVPSDNHLFEGDGESESDKQAQKEIEKEWKKRIIEAGEHAKNIGKLPSGMGRYIDDLLEDKLNWKQLLAQEIRNEIINDYSFTRPSKKALAHGIYLPSVKKENVDVRIVIDLSGSISEKDMKDFLTEIVGMSKAFKDRINMEIITHETEPSEPIEVNRANEEKILNIKFKGGGGTEALPTIKYLNKKNNSLVIWLTDGYFETVTRDDINFKVLWVLTKDGTDESIKDTGRVLTLE